MLRTHGFIGPISLFLAVTASSCDHSSPSAQAQRVIVTVSPRSVTFTSKGQVTQFSAVVASSAGVSQQVIWTSSLPQVASVDSLGDVTALTAGVTTITATPVADPTAHDQALVTANLLTNGHVP